MNPDLTKLPPPPKGQTGITLDAFKHLPPPPQGQQGFTLDQIKGNKKDQIASENADLQKKSDYLNSPKGIIGNTIAGTAKGLLGGAATFAKSAIAAPFDIARGIFGKAPLTNKQITGTDGGTPTIQSQATQKTADVYDQKKSPLRATAELTGQTVGGALDVLGAEGLLRPTGKVLQKGVSKLDEGYQAYKEARAVKTATKDATKITDMISPKATAKEAKLATTQGRFVEGKKPTLFKAGTEDTIKPSSKTLKASDTIQKNIPNASKMSPQELYQAVDKNIGETATKLRPQMEATSIEPKTIEKLNTDWETLKKTQLEDAPKVYGQNGEIKPDANVVNRQQKFESLLKESGSGTHADLWDTAIKYDNSILDNVKKANTLSSESLQLQKQEWLDNRKLLSDAIEKSSKPEFAQMSSMYEAKTGLLSKSKVNEAALSKVNQFLKDNPKTAKVLGGVTVYEIAKHLGIPLP